MGLSEQDESLLTTFAVVSGLAIVFVLIFSYFRERVPKFFLARDSWCVISLTVFFTLSLVLILIISSTFKMLRVLIISFF